jgi:radical SAM superfamily enzyme YgiQ (UPF0313 family)
VIRKRTGAAKSNSSPAGSSGFADPRVTIVHTSKNISGNPDTLLMPLGLVALGNYLVDNEYITEIIHLELEEELNPHFNIIEHLSTRNSGIVCFDLHWHYQANKVMETANKIKYDLPDIKIVIGGFTASLFAEEIIEENTFIDFIIKGDSEVPLLKLVEAILSGREDYKGIPNLVFRKNNKVIVNDHTYVIDQKKIDGLRFSDYSIVSNGDKYNKLHLNMPECLSCKGDCEDKYFYYNCGRGCPVNCSFCGGSCISQRIINKRERPIFISHDSVVRELANAISQGLSTWYTCYDPDPSSEYYPVLFEKIREERMKMKLQFECWALPTRRFVDEFSETFAMSKSIIILSPETGSDEVRKKNKGMYYTNREMVEIIEYCREKGVNVKLYFSVGLPYEGKPDLLKTFNLINYCRNLNNVKVIALTIEFEPGSPIFYDRVKYGVESVRAKFRDYLGIHKKKSNVGYRTGIFSMREIEEIVNLMNAEARCVYPKSNFLKAVSDKDGGLEKVDILSLRSLCDPCERHSKCFIDIMDLNARDKVACWC